MLANPVPYVVTLFAGVCKKIHFNPVDTTKIHANVSIQFAKPQDNVRGVANTQTFVYFTYAHRLGSA